MEIIDKTTWARKELCDFFGAEESPFYEMTFDFDVSQFYPYIKENNLSFYFSTVFLATQTINEIDAFLYKLQGDKVAKHEFLYAGSTDATQNGLFHYITIDNIKDMGKYCEYAHKVSANQHTLFGTPLCPQDQMIFFTCVPWVPFTSLSNIRPGNKDNSIPHITFGKFTKKEGKLMLPCSILVNHRLIDGSHIGEFYNKMQQKLLNY